MLILYAEDDREDADVFREVVESLNSKIICLTVNDGTEVFTFLQDAVTLPDLIFMDVNMPLMNGKDCLVKLKSNKEFKSIPVFIYTTSKLPRDIEEFKKLGAAEYLIKPSSFSEMSKMLSNVIGNRP